MPLKNNPFSFRYVTSLPYFFPPGSPENMLTLLAERFEQCGRVAQIVGPHGTGKSTLLEALIGQLRQPVFKIVLRDRQRRLPNLPDEFSVVTIDGYEQLSTFSRWRLWRKRRRDNFGLLITSHQPVFGWPILYETAPNREVYECLFRILLKNKEEINLQTFDSLLTKHQGNMRQILLDFYDQWEEKTPSSARQTTPPA